MISATRLPSATGGGSTGGGLSPSSLVTTATSPLSLSLVLSATTGGFDGAPAPWTRKLSKATLDASLLPEQASTPTFCPPFGGTPWTSRNNLPLMKSFAVPPTVVTRIWFDPLAVLMASLCCQAICSSHLP